MSGIMTLAVPQGLAALYAQTDAERFPWASENFTPEQAQFFWAILD